MSLRMMYLVLFIISIVMIFYILIISRRIKSAVALRMSVLMGAFIVEAGACLTLAFVGSEESATLAFSFAYISTDIMLLYMFVLIRYFVKEAFTSKLRLSVLFTLITADCVSMLLNVFFGHAFRVYRMSYAGETFFQSSFLPGMITRLILLYFVCFLIALALIKRIVLLPRIYSRRYVSVLLLLIVMLIWDSLFSILKLPVNTEILGNAVFAFVIYHCAIGYIPGKVYNNIFRKAVNDDRDGLAFFDADDECIYTNDSLFRLTGIGEDKEAATQQMQELVEAGEIQLDENNTKMRDLVLDGVTRHLQTEVQALRDKRNRKIGNLIRVQDLTKEVTNAERQHFLATHDTLTGAYNREGFYLMAREIIDKNPDCKRLLLRFNYRDFKYVNNYFGLKKGDEILCNTVNILNDAEAEETILGRFYGDDFVMLMREQDYNEEQYSALLDRLSHNIVDTYYTIYMHMGVYEIEDSQMSVAQMCDYASLALEGVKPDRGNRISHYSGDIMEQQLHEKEVISRFEDALAGGEFCIYLQPQVSSDGKLIGAEALARWISPDKGLVLPAEFIPVLERNGLVYKLDQFVWGEVAKLLAKWKDISAAASACISVNVSPKDIYYLDLYNIFMDYVEQYQIDPALFKIEITETTIMRDRRRYTSLIDSLHARGFEFEMDDFGSGYSSLGILQDIAVDILKIDRSFIREAESNDRSRIILGMVMSMARKLNMQVVVEGVETGDQVYFLEALGCKIFQGFYFAKPMPVAEFEEKYFQKSIHVKQ